MNINKLIKTVPSDRQMIVQQMEFYGFIHFGMNTFSQSEWGTGKEDPNSFNLKHFNSEQIVTTIKSAGMSGVLITAKHHDGFCLWDTKYTTHSVNSSPYKHDIVMQLADECKKQNIKLGVYLSPWDMNSEVYGQGTAYDDFFVNQLTELLTNYGDIFSVWFDGACGEGANGKKQVYDWERYYQVIRKLQPNACINVCGPDIRWCGNEAGITRDREWSVVPKTLQDNEKISENSQQEDNVQFREKKFDSTDMDLGSREVVKDVSDFVWYPAEVDVSIRPGWFYHESEDNKVKDFETLKKLYYASVGGNAMLLLNIPPTREGEIHKRDVEELTKLGDFLKTAFGNNLIGNGSIIASSTLDKHTIENVKVDNYESYYASSEEICEIIIELDKLNKINHIVLKENIMLSQRIEKFKIELYNCNQLVKEYSGETIGYKKIIPIERVDTNKLVIKVSKSRSNPNFSFIGVY